MNSSLSTKRSLSYAEHLKIVEGLITHQTNCMESMNKYIEQIRHPSTTFSMVIASRDKVCQSLRSLQGIKVLLNSYMEEDLGTPDT